MNSPSSTAYFIGSTASKKKAVDIKILNVKDISPIADYFVICSGNSSIHVRAIADEIEDKMAEKGINPDHKEGYQGAGWILLDYGDVIVHIFSAEYREFYGIERLWADAEVVNL